MYYREVFMSNKIAIKVDHLFKVYRLYDHPMDRLKESLHPFRKRYSKDFYALKNISFEINKGDTVGIIGKNGAGKSTLLKILTGVLTPTSGGIQLNGKIAALLELGAGFNFEMTGIENIYMSGTIMGYSKKEMDEKIQDIIDFADIGEFIHQQVKMYSSGMFARLAFAVNASVNPDILIVDEALSVGDVFFQNKCFKKFDELRERGVTILFVSHDMSSVKQLCSKVLWIENGIQQMFDVKEKVCEAYFSRERQLMNQLNGDLTLTTRNNEVDIIQKTGKVVFPPININDRALISKDVEIKSFFILDGKGERTVCLQSEKEYNVVIVAEFYHKLTNVIFGFVVENKKGIQIIGINSFINNQEKMINIENEGIVAVKFNFKMPKIMAGEYLVSPAIAQGDQKQHNTCTWLSNLMKIRIENDGYNLSLVEIESNFEMVKYEKENVVFS